MRHDATTFGACTGSLGLAELLTGEPGSPEEQWALQRQDLGGVGHLVLTLACAGAAVPSLEACAAVCSAELTRLLGALIDAPHGGAIQSWRQVRRWEDAVVFVLSMILVSAKPAYTPGIQVPNTACTVV